MQPLNYYKRHEKIKELMEQKGVEILVVPPSSNFIYLFRAELSMRERLICGVLALDEEPFILCPAFEKERIERETGIKNVVTWKEEENPYNVLKENISKKAEIIALENSAPFWVYLQLKKVFSEAKFEGGDNVISPIRAVKEPAEIERIRKAIELGVKGMLETINNLTEGQTEREVQEIVQKRMTELSGELSWALVQFGENTAIPHSSSTNKKLQKGMAVLIDAGTSVDRYYGDITITTSFGNPSKEFLEIFEIVQEANNKALETSREGVEAEKVDLAARKVIEQAGYGAYFTHRLGHGLGLDVHEEPYIVQGNTKKLQRGNVHTDEPGIYIPGKFGVRIEDDVLVDKKSERLYEFDRYLWE